MYEMLERSLSPYLAVNENSDGRDRLIIDRKSVLEYVTDSKYLTIIAGTDSGIAGWLSGSSHSEVLSDHGCKPGEFYIEEIVVDSEFRRKGIGESLLEKIQSSGLSALVIDTPSLNREAIRFYEKEGFLPVEGLPDAFARKWTRMSKKL